MLMIELETCTESLSAVIIWSFTKSLTVGIMPLNRRTTQISADSNSNLNLTNRNRCFLHNQPKDGITSDFVQLRKPKA